MSDQAATRIKDYLSDQKPQMTRFLENLVRVETPSTVPETQDALLAQIARFLRAIDYRVVRYPGSQSGGQLLGIPNGRKKGRPVQLLIGHGDTVWPLGTLREMPVTIKDGFMRGPGTYDMKAGLTQMLFAMQAIRDLEIPTEVTPVAVVTTDEEVGSRESRNLLIRLARIADRAWILEPSLGPDGRLKTRRKGVGRFEIRIKGLPAHAGLDPEKGASAIIELMHVVQALNALNDPERGVSINVGQIEGGTRPNVVAPTSRAVVDVRVPTEVDAKRIEAEIRGLTPKSPAASIEIIGGMGRHPLEQTPRNRHLWSLARDAGSKLGFNVTEGMAGGGSDGNITSLFTATLDGLGATGDGAHAQHEYVSLEHMVERAALLTLLLTAPPVRNSFEAV